MSVTPLQLEEAILRAVFARRNDDWVQYSIGDLKNHIAEVDARTANESINVIIDALVALGVQGYLEFGKFEAEQRLAFDFVRQRDSRYLNQFFAIRPFDLRLTHEGRKRIAQPTASKRRGEFPATIEDVRSEIVLGPNTGTIAAGIGALCSSDRPAHSSPKSGTEIHKPVARASS